MKDNNSSLLSVIVPIYNVKDYLKECIESIISQSHMNLEIILVDDGSTDGSAEICDEFKKKDSRVIVIHKKNGGVSSARNAGIKIASGAYIAFVDSDDFIDKSMYEKLIKSIKENNTDIAFCRYREVYENKIVNVYEQDLQKFCSKNYVELVFSHSGEKCKSNNLKYIKNKVRGVLWRGVYRRCIFDNVKFNEKVTLMEDCLVLAKLLVQGCKISLVDEYLYNYTIREVSITHKPKDMLQNYLNFFSEISNTLADPCYEKLLSSIKYFCYSIIFMDKYIKNVETDINQISTFGSYENYRANKKYTFGLKQKVKFFLIRHKLIFILKKLYKFKDL